MSTTRTSLVFASVVIAAFAPGCAANASDGATSGQSGATVTGGHAVNAAAFKIAATCDASVECCVGGSEPLLDIDEGIAGGECGLRLYDQGCGGALKADGSVDTNAPVRAVAREGGHWWAEVVCPAGTKLPSACEKQPYDLATPEQAARCEASFPRNAVFFVDPTGTCTGCSTSSPPPRATGGCGATCGAQ